MNGLSVMPPSLIFALWIRGRLGSWKMKNRRISTDYIYGRLFREDFSLICIRLLWVSCGGCSKRTGGGLPGGESALWNLLEILKCFHSQIVPPERHKAFCLISSMDYVEYNAFFNKKYEGWSFRLRTPSSWI